MNIPRRGHACGKFEKDGKIVIIVAGGYDQSLQDLDSIEYLIPSTGQGWKFGKYVFLQKAKLFIKKYLFWSVVWILAVKNFECRHHVSVVRGGGGHYI